MRLIVIRDGGGLEIYNLHTPNSSYYIINTNRHILLDIDKPSVYYYCSLGTTKTLTSSSPTSDLTERTIIYLEESIHRKYKNVNDKPYTEVNSKKDPLRRWEMTRISDYIQEVNELVVVSRVLVRDYIKSSSDFIGYFEELVNRHIFKD